MKDFLIVLSLFLAIILIGKVITPIPSCPKPADTTTDQQIEDWKPFTQN